MPLIRGLSQGFDQASARIPGHGTARRQDSDCELDASGGNN